MPWKKTDQASEQQKFIVAWQGEAHTPFSELCRRFGISRKTGYKRVSRFNEFGLSGIGDLSSAPWNHPNQTSAEVVEMLVRAKRHYMMLGPKKLVMMLATAHPGTEFPAASTASDILKANGLVIPRRRNRKSAPWAEPFSDAQRPNDIWCADFKGWFLTGDGVRCNPLTVSDATSRHLINCTGLLRPGFEEVRPIFELAFREFGLPLAMRTDNGTPFASTALGGLSRLSVWWIKLGIIPERIRPGHPEENGRHERMHRTLGEAVAVLTSRGGSSPAMESAATRLRSPMPPVGISSIAQVC